MPEENEIWKSIEIDSQYTVSNLGSIRSITRTIIRKDGKIKKFKGKLLKSICRLNGYHYVALSNQNRKAKQYSVHRLVASAFIPNPHNKPQINHINGIKTDNRVENLEWCTQGENNTHAYRTGIKKHHKCWLGKSGYAHNKSKEVIEYRNDIEVRRFGSGAEMGRSVGLRNYSYYIHNRIEVGGKIYKYA